MKLIVKITFVVGICLRLVLFITPSLAGSLEDCNEYRDPMMRIACVQNMRDEYLMSILSRASDSNRRDDQRLDPIPGYGDDIEVVDPVGGLVADLCCEANDEYESIDCAGIRGRWARWACLFSKINAKKDVFLQCCDDDPSCRSCSIDPTGKSCDNSLTSIALSCLVSTAG